MRRDLAQWSRKVNAVHVVSLTTFQTVLLFFARDHFAKKEKNLLYLKVNVAHSVNQQIPLYAGLKDRSSLTVPLHVPVPVTAILNYAAQLFAFQDVPVPLVR